MKTCIIYFFWIGLWLPVGLVLGLLTGVTGTVGDVLARVSDTLEGWAYDWKDSFPTLWMRKFIEKGKE